MSFSKSDQKARGRDRQRLARAFVPQVPDGRVGARETLRRGEGLPATIPTVRQSGSCRCRRLSENLRGAQLADEGAAGNQTGGTDCVSGDLRRASSRLWSEPAGGRMQRRSRRSQIPSAYLEILR